jgi:N-acetylmuramoyl-L-alanine amidase
MDFAFAHRKGFRIVCLIVFLASICGGLPVRQAVGGQAKEPAKGDTLATRRAEPLRSGVESSLGSVTRIRVGVHDGYTRVVFDLAGPYEWSLDQPATGPLRVVIPGVSLDDAVRRIDYPRGLLRSIQPFRRSGGVEILLVCEPSQVRARPLTLADPHRIVVDVMLPGPGDGDRANAQRTAPAPAKPAPTVTAGVAKSRAAAPPAPMPEAPPPAESALRPPPAQTVPERGPAGGGATPAIKESEREEAAPLTIVLDPGHGGHDTGAIGPSGLMEKDVVLDLALRLRRLLQQRLGVRVLMTRTEDVFVSLPERSAFANRVKADFLVSLHVNAANKRGAVGFETFYFTREPSDNDARASTQRENLVIENNGSTGKDLESLLKTTLADMAVTRDMKESSNLAERILAALEKILRVENRGVKSGPFYVLATAAMPAVLVESAFITNPREERKLQREEYREQLARALFDGIAAYKVRYEQRLGLGNAPAGFGS